MAITQKQIAQHLGISPQAVSFALGDTPGQVSEETRRQVKEAARKLGYRANTAARAVATGRFNAIGLVMGQDMSLSSIHGDVLLGIYEILEAAGIHMNLTILPEQKIADPDWLPHVLSHEMVDGLLIYYTHDVPENLKQVIRRHHIPAVWLNRKQAENAVYFDDVEAAYRMTCELIQWGHRRIVFSHVGRPSNGRRKVHYSHLDREQGYRNAMHENGLPPDCFFPEPDLSTMQTINLATDCLRESEPPTAVLGYGGDELIWMAAAHVKQLRLGRDFSLVFFNTVKRLIHKEMDLLSLPEAELGRAAARMLLQRIFHQGDQVARALHIPHRSGQTIGRPV